MKTNRFYYSKSQKAVAEGSCSHGSRMVWDDENKKWVEYTEWCTTPEYVPNWEDSVLVYSTDDPVYTKGVDDPYETPADLPYSLYSEVKCDCCGKIIPRGKNIFKVQGYTYNCCSAECLLYAMVPSAYTKKCSGYYDD